MKTVAIIGAGPSGIMAALTLKEQFNNDIDILLFEKNNRIGKKIIVSGNGKCNITNDDLDDLYIYNNDFAKKIVQKYTPNMLKEQLLKWGIFTKTDNSSRVYPLTESANTVMEMLLLQLNQLQINIKTSTIVTKINQENDKYIINTLSDGMSKSYSVDYVIVSTGGKSSKIHGSNGEGYKLLEDLNVTITKVKPGLVGLKLKENEISGLSGIRQKACVKLYENDCCIYSELGEIQFKNDGISGIVVMNASSIIARSNYKLSIVIDFLPNFENAKLIEKLNMVLNSNSKLNFEDLTHGLLPKALSIKICNILKMKKDLTVTSFVKLAKNYTVDIIDTYGFDASQVSVGGVNIEEVLENLELVKYKNIYVIGELLDVDGLCGGYNMHFAFASGAVVSDDIYQKEVKKYEK